MGQRDDSGPERRHQNPSVPQSFQDNVTVTLDSSNVGISRTPAHMQDGFTAVATGLVALKELVTIGHIQQDQASCLLQAFGACLRVAHRALFCPRCAGQSPSDTPLFRPWQSPAQAQQADTAPWAIHVHDVGCSCPYKLHITLIMKAGALYIHVKVLRLNGLLIASLTNSGSVTGCLQCQGQHMS